MVVESPEKLLDWGVRRKGTPADVLVRRRLKPLLELWRPTFIVIRGPRQIQPRQKSLRGRLLKGVVAEAKNYRARVQILKERPTDRAEKLTKYERAQAVVKLFPVLTQKLPPKRKCWESEDYRMSMFAAATLAMAYLRY